MCAAPLESGPTAYTCSAGHGFDRSREGYVNLLLRPPRNRSSGDSLEMIHARRRFLDGGHFDAVRDAVLGAVGPGPLLDVGCGEGYYTRPRGQIGGTWVGGIDVSRPAIRLAARRGPDIAYAVANAFDLPVVSGSIDNVVSVFGPIAPDEIDRVLSSAGRVVVAGPAPSHLIELKELLLSEARPHELRHPLQDDPRFRVTEQARVTRTLVLDRPEVEALVDMTPYRWQIPAERRSQRDAIDAMTVTADCLIITLARARAGSGAGRSPEGAG
ncbi:MAG TPA: methyltransferase domain-containing protein [Acidimicrobiales bacterium]|nr:methyltransferase domain-containing protein [Acidimicrobiales bacterium]